VSGIVDSTSDAVGSFKYNGIIKIETDDWVQKTLTEDPLYALEQAVKNGTAQPMFVPKSESKFWIRFNLNFDSGYVLLGGLKPVL
jgi:hypothetical protein